LVNSHAQEFLKPTNGKGPDFVLEKFCDNKNVYIECVCPQEADQEKSKGEPIKNENNIRIEEEVVLGNIEGYSSREQGYNDPIVSRYVNSAKEKAKKFEKYPFTKGHYRILCVSGAVMGELKAKEHNSCSSYLSTKDDFEAAICPGKWFTDENGNFKFQPAVLKIKRGEKSFSVGYQDYLKTFDAIIFSDILPFNTTRSGNIFYVKYRDEDASGKLSPCLEEIFK